MNKPLIGRDTRLCMSLSARPGNFGTRFHNRLYELLGLDYVYKAFSTQDLAGVVRGIRALNIRGCAVSMPFKEDVIPLLDALEGSAAAIDSVNTIVNDDGRLMGFNTDYLAVRNLIEASGLDQATPFLLLGCGGMAKAVAAALRDTGFTQGTIVARNETRGPALAKSYGFDWLPEQGRLTAPFLINVTPLGMEGPEADILAFPEDQIVNAALIMDVVALPAETPLLKAAKAYQKPTITGAEIIVLQAVEQFILYTGARPTESQIQDAAAFARSAA